MATTLRADGDGGAPATSGVVEYEFCKVLNEGMTTMAGNAAGAGSGDLDQFSLMLTQLAETSRLIGRLAEVAPDEIAGDMRRAAKAWDDQMAAVGKGVGDPLGALGLIFVSGLTSAASLSAVDEWSSANCGRAVFAVAGTRAGTGTLCGWFPPDSTLRQYGVLEPETSADALEQLLTLLEANLLDANDNAGKVLRAVRTLEPPARTSLEALGRLQWTDVDPVASLEAIRQQFNSQCGTEQEWVSSLSSIEKRVSAMRPARLGFLPQDDAFWNCGGVVAVVHPLTAIAQCDGEDAFVSVDLVSGAVNRIEVPGAMPFGDYALKSAGDRIVWVSSVDVPQTGLEEPETKRSLHSWVPGSTPTSVEVSSFPTKDEDLDFGDLVAADGDHVLTHTFGSPDRVRLWTTEGRLLAEYNFDSVSTVQATAHLAVLLGGWDETDSLVDLRNGQSTDLGSGSSIDYDAIGYQNEPSRCGDRLLYHADGLGVVPILETPDGSDASLRYPQPDRLASWGPVALPRRDRYATYWNDGELRIFDSSGSIVGEYSNEVLKKVWPVFGWFVVTNKAGNKIVVDPVTGNEASGLSSELTEFLQLEPWQVVYRHHDQGAQTITVLTRTGLYELDFKQLCPQ